jgi:hypothetical protein
MSKQYLILIDELVREGRSEREIDRIVREVIAEDERALWFELSEESPTGSAPPDR